MCFDRPTDAIQLGQALAVEHIIARSDLKTTL
jgi:hypothetical protein